MLISVKNLVKTNFLNFILRNFKLLKVIQTQLTNKPYALN